MAIDTAIVRTPIRPEALLQNLDGKSGATTSDLNNIFLSVNTPFEALMFGANGSSGAGNSAPFRVCGRQNLTFQVVGAGTGTFTVFGSLDGLTWYSMGTIAATGLTSFTTRPSYIYIQAATTTGTYNVALVAY